MIKLFESIHTSGEKIRKESFCFFVFFFGKKTTWKEDKKFHQLRLKIYGN